MWRRRDVRSLSVAWRVVRCRVALSPSTPAVRSLDRPVHVKGEGSLIDGSLWGCGVSRGRVVCGHDGRTAAALFDFHHHGPGWQGMHSSRAVMAGDELILCMDSSLWARGNLSPDLSFKTSPHINWRPNRPRSPKSWCCPARRVSSLSVVRSCVSHFSWLHSVLTRATAASRRQLGAL